jgi:hypothetical protein
VIVNLQAQLSHRADMMSVLAEGRKQPHEQQEQQEQQVMHMLLSCMLPSSVLQASMLIAIIANAR